MIFNIVIFLLNKTFVNEHEPGAWRGALKSLSLSWLSIMTKNKH